MSERRIETFVTLRVPVTMPLPAWFPEDYETVDLTSARIREEFHAMQHDGSGLGCPPVIAELLKVDLDQSPPYQLACWVIGVEFIAHDTNPSFDPSTDALPGMEAPKPLVVSAEGRLL